VQARAWLVLPLVTLAPLAAARPAVTKVPRATIEPRLRNYKPDPAAWRAMGPGTDEALIEIAGDGKTEVLLRSRALSTLSNFPTPAVRKFLETTVTSKATSADPTDRVLVGKAAVALGWVGGTGVPDQLAPLLDHVDADVRLDAAIGMGLTRLPSAAELLRKRLDIEQVERVRAQISRQIQVIDASRPPPAAPGK
jgi:HEAT repeat protein